MFDRVRPIDADVGGTTKVFKVAEPVRRPCSHCGARVQELRKIGRDYPFICPVDFKPHRGSPPGQDPRLDPDFVPTHREDDGAHWLG